MLVLASQSPRRSEILRQAGIPFTVRVAAVDETPLEGEKPADYVLRLAELKALAVPAGPHETVLGADTTVVIDGEMLGGPAHHVIYFPSEDAWQAYPAWARDRRAEIIARIKSKFGTPAYEHHGA